MSDETQLEVAVFEAAMAVSDPQQRRAIVDAACRDDLAFRNRVEELLTAADSAGSFMQQAAAELADETTDGPNIISPRRRVLKLHTFGRKVAKA